LYVRVAVVGGGIAGVTCARELVREGAEVTVFDRGHRLGGRLAAQTLRETGTSWDGHIVDVGASYFTASDPAFLAQIADWRARGLVGEWTDSFHVWDARGLSGPKSGPMRYSTPRGLRSAVEDIASGLGPEVAIHHPVDVTSISWADCLMVDGVSYDAVAICTPDPQALRLIDTSQPALAATRSAADGHVHIWEPALALVAVFEERVWPDIDGVFVNDDPTLTWIADDGRRRGDGAAVLVAHSTPALAARNLRDPGAVGPQMRASLRSVLGIDQEPSWHTVKRWTYAKPATARPEPCFWDAAARVGLAGDAWGGQSRVEAAFCSGMALASRIIGGPSR